MKTRASVINRFLSSFGCDLWRIQIVPRQSAAGVPPRNIIAQSLTLSTAQVLARLPWLSFANCNAGEIYFRPLDASGKMRWILVDDVAAAKTKKLKAIGASAIVLTSPGNLQAWFALATPVEAGCAIDLARQMSGALAGDMHSADNPLQAGRMPAFTNHKPSHCVDGHRPLCRLVWAHARTIAPDVAPSAVESVQVSDIGNVGEMKRVAADWFNARRMAEVGKSEGEIAEWLSANSACRPQNHYYAQKTARRAVIAGKIE